LTLPTVFGLHSCGDSHFVQGVKTQIHSPPEMSYNNVVVLTIMSKEHRTRKCRKLGNEVTSRLTSQ